MDNVLRDVLWRIVSAETGRYGFTLAPGCEEHLHGFIQTGVNQLVSRSAQPGFSNDVKEAEINLRRFILAMIAEELNTGGRQLHESNFYSIKSLLCPCRPFC